MDIIKKYLIEDKKSSEKVATLISSKFSQHSDIKEELELCISKGEDAISNPVSICGYTAKSILKIQPLLELVGAYSFLITLREKPQKAKEYIDEGIPVL